MMDTAGTLQDQGKKITSYQDDDEEEECEEFEGILNSSLMLYKELHDKLYKYQKEGLAFLYSLHKNRKGGILADDMGLGKTVQILTFLSGMFDMDLIKTVLLVVPVSLISNWMEEVRKWTPGMHVKVFHTSSRSLEESLKTIQEKGDVLITTYQMLVNRLEMLSHHRSKDFIWDIVIFDEAHKLKKPSNKTTKAASVIPSKTRILLTGTPVQNNLQEMWALFSVACQGAILGSYKSFKKLYETPITRGRMKDASISEKALGFKISENLMEIIKPYYLRRTKLDVGKECHDSQNKENCPPNSLPHLPEKSDLVVWLYLSPLQERIYRDILSSEKIKNILLSSACPLTELTMLKSLCDHPRLLSVNGSLALNDSYNSLIQESRKLAFLVALLEKLCSDGHRTLVFCRSCKMLNIIEKVLTAKKFHFLRIDGTVKQIELRNRRVSMFQTKSDYSIMLLTTQVGGVGLNLTAANRVVIFDPSWNPATDAQAIDRVYRIGQEKNVIVYRLITCGTVEEKVFRRQVFKNSLIRQVTGDEKDPFRHFTHEQLKDVFTLGNTRLSLTQIQLQSMSITQSTRNAELEEHTAFLQSLDIFGISHTNLVFSMTQEGNWDSEDGEKISLKVQKAQKTLESESLQQECGVGRLSLERGVGRNHQVSSTKEMKRPTSSSCGLHYLAVTKGNSDGDRNFNHGMDEELDPENGDGASCSCSSLTVSEPLNTSPYLYYDGTIEEHSEINLQNQLHPRPKNTPEPTNSTDHFFKMIGGRSESNMKINSVMVEEPCVNSTPHSFHGTPSTETLSRSSDLHMIEMTGESSARKKSSSAKAEELNFKCANNESHSFFSVASEKTSSRSSDPHIVDVIRERYENDVKISSEMVEESSLKSHSVISKCRVNTTFTEPPNSSSNLHFFHVIESSKRDTKIGSGTDNSHLENVDRTPCTWFDSSTNILRNSAGLPYIGEIEGNSENISSVLEEKSHIQNVDSKPCSCFEGTLTEVLSSSSVLHYAGTKKQNSGDKKIRSIRPEKSFLQIVDSTPHNRSETTSTETQSNLPNLHSFQKKGGNSENEMKISNVTMEESDLQNIIAVHQLNCFDTASAEPLGKSLHPFLVDVIQGSAQSNQKMTDITPDNSCLQNVDSTIDSRLNGVSTELPSGLHYDGVIGRKSEMKSRNATGERSHPLCVDSMPHNWFKTTLAETPSRAPSLHLVATIGDCSESENLCSVTGEKANLQNVVISPDICFNSSAAEILSGSSDLHLVDMERETSESARKISILPLKESDPQNISSMQQSEFNTVSSNVLAGTTSCCQSGGPAFDNILSLFNKLIIENTETSVPTTTQNQQQNFGSSGTQDDENSIISPTFCNDSFSLENNQLSHQLFPDYQDFSVVLTSTPRPKVACGTRESEVFPKGHFLLEDFTAIGDSTRGCSIDLSCDRGLQKVSGDKLALLDYSAASKCMSKLADKMFPYNTGSPKFSDSEIQQKQERHFWDNGENDNEKRNKTPLGFKHHDSLFRSQPSCSDLKWESNVESPASSSRNFTKSKSDFEEGFNSDVPCSFHLILNETQPAGRQTENVLQLDTFHNFLASAQGVHEEGVSDIEDISMQHKSKLHLPLQHIVSVNSFEEKQQQPKKEKERSFYLKSEVDTTGTEIPTSALCKHYETDSSLDKISEGPCEQEGAPLFNSTRTLAKNQFNLQSNHESKLGIPKRCLIM